MEYALEVISYPVVEVGRSIGGVFKRGFEHLHDHFIPHARNNYHPHILGHRVLAFFSILLVSVKIAGVVLVTAAPALPALSSAITAENIFNLTNQSRTSNGLSALTENSLLDSAANSKAQALVACGCFQHNLPDGRTPWDFFKAVGYNYIVAGENLAVDFEQAENVEDAWMNSPGHRANILNKDYEDIGIGISRGQFQGHDSIFVVQEFGAKAAQPTKTLDTPTVVSKPAPSTQLQATATPPPAKPSLFNTAAASDSSSPVVTTPQPVSISDTSFSVEGDKLLVEVTTTGPVSKVLVSYGGKAAMLDPKDNGLWQTEIPLAGLGQTQGGMVARAFDMKGNLATAQAASFYDSVQQNYNPDPVPTAKPSIINFFGMQVDPKTFENKFYLLFIAGILTSLIIAIAVKRHVQHLSLIANSSFIVILATLLWIGS